MNKSIQLMQREFVSLSRIMEATLRYKPKSITVAGGKLIAIPAMSDACIVVDLSKLIKAKVEMRIEVDSNRIKELKHIRGGKKVSLSVDPRGAGYCFSGDHYEVDFREALNSEDVEFQPGNIEWLGVPVNGYDPKVLKRYLGRGANNVLLGVYGDQVEQIAHAEARAEYTFSKGMQEELRNRTPDLVLQSQLAFAWMTKNHEFQLGRVGAEYLLMAKNKIDHETFMEVYEGLKPFVS